MEQQKVDLDALEAALGKSTPGVMRAVPNGGFCMDEDENYWGFESGPGYFEGLEAGGFNLTGFIAKQDAERLEASYNALPGLIAELRQLRARVTPEPIGEKHRDGNWWMVWSPLDNQWYKALWHNGHWEMAGRLGFYKATHALPLPPAPEAQ